MKLLQDRSLLSTVIALKSFRMRFLAWKGRASLDERLTWKGVHSRWGCQTWGGVVKRLCCMGALAVLSSHPDGTPVWKASIGALRPVGWRSWSLAAGILEKETLLHFASVIFVCFSCCDSTPGAGPLLPGAGPLLPGAGPSRRRASPPRRRHTQRHTKAKQHRIYCQHICQNTKGYSL